MNWLKKLMIGRYGVDQLSYGMIILSLILMVVGLFTKWEPINYITMALIVLGYLRMFSKNINKRYQENQKFLKWWNPIKFKWQGFVKRIKQSKTHRFFKCPSCKKQLRVPKGKGKINITCPHCQTKFESRT